MTIGIFLISPLVLSCDNLSALYLAIDLVFSCTCKTHVEYYHLVRENVANGTLITRFIPANYQLAEIFTKTLSKTPFTNVRIKLGFHNYSQLLLKGCNREVQEEKIQKQRRQQEPTSL